MASLISILVLVDEPGLRRPVRSCFVERLDRLEKQFRRSGECLGEFLSVIFQAKREFGHQGRTRSRRRSRGSRRQTTRPSPFRKYSVSPVADPFEGRDSVHDLQRGVRGQLLPVVTDTPEDREEHSRLTDCPGQLALAEGSLFRRTDGLRVREADEERRERCPL